MDPLDFRLKNHAEVEPISGKPFSSKALRECYREGAERFGWERRLSVPRQMRDRGGLLVGWGVGTATFPAFMFAAQARAVLRRDGSGDPVHRPRQRLLGRRDHIALRVRAPPEQRHAVHLLRWRPGRSDLDGRPLLDGQFPDHRRHRWHGGDHRSGRAQRRQRHKLSSSPHTRSLGVFDCSRAGSISTVYRLSAAPASASQEMATRASVEGSRYSAISASHRLVCWAQPRRPPPAQRRGRKKARPSAHTNSPVPDRRRLYADMAKPNLNADNPKEGLTADGYGVLPPTRSSVSLLTGSASRFVKLAAGLPSRRRQNARNALPCHGRPHRARRDGSRFTFHPVASSIPDHFLSTSPGTF